MNLSWRIGLTALPLLWVCYAPRAAAQQQTESTSQFRALGVLRPSDTYSIALGISSDSRVVVGSSGGEAFRWAADSGMVGLGHLLDLEESTAVAASRDGSVIVGYATNLHAEGYPTLAFRWTQETGMLLIGPASVQ